MLLLTPLEASWTVSLIYPICNSSRFYLQLLFQSTIVLKLNEQPGLYFNIIFVSEVIHYMFLEMDEGRKEELYKEIISTIAPFILGKLDTIAKEKGGHMALNRVSSVNI